MTQAAAAMEPLVETRQLTRFYKRQVAVEGLNLRLFRGEIVALMGLNGAGKSTLLKMLVGLLRPSRGEIYFQGKPLASHLNAAKRQIGYLAESNPLHADSYVREFLSFNAQILELAQGRIQEVLHQLGLEAQQHKKIGQLSKGYQQRVGLARALLHRPALLVLDEPTTGLDPLQLVAIREIISGLGTAQTVLLSTHWVQEVEAIADRVLILHRGRLLADRHLKDFHGKLETQFKNLTQKA